MMKNHAQNASSARQFVPLALALSLQLAGTVQAQLIDVDFNTNSPTGTGPASGPTMSGAAVLGVAGDHWNGIDASSGAGIPLIYANGSNSPVTMTFTSGGGYDATDYGGSTPFASTPYNALMEDYLYNGGVSQTITLSGLAPNSLFDLILYNAADANVVSRTTIFTVNGNVQSSTWNGTNTALTPGVDYAEFTSAFSDGSGNLAITWIGNGSAEGDLNGFQIAVQPVHASPGLDPSFAGIGQVTVGFDGAVAAAHAVAIQPDGKLVIAGQASTGTFSSVFALARLNPDGSLDDSFGSNGTVTTTLSTVSGDVGANALAIQSDGKIVAAGSSESHFAVVRYNTDGSPDTSFGSNGIVTVLVGTGGGGPATAVRIQPDGKIVAAGFAEDTSLDNQFAVARFNTNGTLDTSFGAGGSIITTIGTESEAYAAGIQPDGKIVAGGLTASLSGSTLTADFAAARYKTNGALDFSFGSLGRTTNNVGGGTVDGAYAMAIQPHGKIVLAGAAAFVTLPGPATGNMVVNSFVALARFNTNGTPDPSFGDNGMVLSEVGGYSDYALSAAVQPDGKILVAGASLSAYYQWFTQRFNSDGSLDSSYGTGGATLLDFGSGTNEFAYALALDSSGRAVVAGDAGGVFGVARLLGDALPVSLRITLTSTNTAIISWPYPSAGWNLQESADLSISNWTTAPETIANDGTNNFIVVSPPSGHLFFRLSNP